MEVVYHPLVRRDLREILEWYDERSETAGDRFFADFERTIDDLLERKRQGFALDKNVRKVFLKQFPYSLTFEIDDETLYVFVVKHQKRHPDYGMRRNRPKRS